MKHRSAFMILSILATLISCSCTDTPLSSSEKSSNISSDIGPVHFSPVDPEKQRIWDESDAEMIQLTVAGGPIWESDNPKNLITKLHAYQNGFLAATTDGSVYAFTPTPAQGGNMTYSHSLVQTHDSSIADLAVNNDEIITVTRKYVSFDDMRRPNPYNIQSVAVYDDHLLSLNYAGKLTPLSHLLNRFDRNLNLLESTGDNPLGESGGGLFGGQFILSVLNDKCFVVSKFINTITSVNLATGDTTTRKRGSDIILLQSEHNDELLRHPEKTSPTKNQRSIFPDAATGGSFLYILSHDNIIDQTNRAVRISIASFDDQMDPVAIYQLSAELEEQSGYDFIFPNSFTFAGNSEKPLFVVSLFIRNTSISGKYSTALYLFTPEQPYSRKVNHD